ncbi:UNVERIFIED_CONTAM: hypothetical protein FKN15_064347 [Acipenser sinensis]
MLQPIRRRHHGNPVPDRLLRISPLFRILNSINFQLPNSRPQALRSLSNPRKPLYPPHQIFKNGPIKPRDPPNTHRGMEKSLPPSSPSGQPISTDLLLHLITALRQACFNPFDDVIMETLCLTAFFGFLRCSEF